MAKRVALVVICRGALLQRPGRSRTAEFKTSLERAHRAWLGLIAVNIERLPLSKALKNDRTIYLNSRNLEQP